MRLDVFHTPILHLLLIAFMCAVVYSGTLDAPFQFDDDYNTIRNPAISDLANIPAMFAGIKGAWASRPLLQATLALNFHFGGFEPRGYHMVNVGLHLTNGILLYLLTVMVGKHLGYAENSARAAALFGALLFVVHPAHTETVISVVNRSMLFAAMFYLLGMMLFLKAATAEGRRPLYIACLSVVSLLGMASREDFATFPVVLFVFDLLFISRFRPRETVKHWREYLPVLLSLAYFAHLALSNTYDKVLSKGIPPLEYVMTQFNVHWTYLRVLLFPINLNVDYNYPAARTLLEVPTIISLFGYIALWALGVLFARKRPVAAFGVLWFLAVLLPISFGVAFMDIRLGDVLFEHRLYLPSAALFPAVVAGVFLMAEKSKVKKSAMAAAGFCIAVVFVLSAAAYERGLAWRSEISLWEDVVRKSPNGARGHYNLARFYSRADFHDKAVMHYTIAITLDPRDPQPHFNLGVLYLGAGMVEDARSEFETTLSLSPGHPEAVKFLRYVSEPGKGR